MKVFATLLCLLLLASCGRPLTDEQRKEIREQMALRTIKRVTESEIASAALSKGREMVAQLEQMKGDSAGTDSLIRLYQGRVRWIIPGKTPVVALEQLVVEAYLAADSGALSDNIQKLRNAQGESDSLLYTYPVIIRSEGEAAEQLAGIWSIWLSKKELILEMDEK